MVICLFKEYYMKEMENMINHFFQQLVNYLFHLDGTMAECLGQALHYLKVAGSNPTSACVLHPWARCFTIASLNQGVNEQLHDDYHSGVIIVGYHNWLQNESSFKALSSNRKELL